MGENRSVFRKHCSKIDQLFTDRQFMEKYWVFDKVVHQVFIDFRQVNDRVLRLELWNAKAAQLSR